MTENLQFRIVGSVWRWPGWATPVLEIDGLPAGEAGVDFVLDWTTDGEDPPREAQIEKAAVLRQADGRWQLFMADPARNVEPAGDGARLNWSVWRADMMTGKITETTRAGQLRLRLREMLARDFGPSMMVPDVVAEPVFIRVNIRTPEQVRVPSRGGGGMQFLRDWTEEADDWFYAVMDAAIGWASPDLGHSFYTPKQDGLWGGYSGASCWRDPDDPRRVLTMYSSNQRLDDAAPSLWDEHVAYLAKCEPDWRNR